MKKIATRRGLPGAVKRVKTAVNNVMYPAMRREDEIRVRRGREGDWRARNKKKIEWKHLRNCANYVGAGVLDALVL